MKVIKRDSREVDFEKEKIVLAIEKAMKYGSGDYEPDVAKRIGSEIEEICHYTKVLDISQIEDMVYHKLIESNHADTAKSYEGYRAVQEYKRESNTTDGSIIGLMNFENEELMRENSNKDAVLSSTQRDLIAGEVSKDLYTRKMLPTHLAQAHEDGIIHIHDRDYLLQNIHNCTVVDLEDMLEHGTVINGKQIRSPKSFQVACTVATQILAQVTSSQYGGASINGIDRILAPYARKSYNKFHKKHKNRLIDMGLDNIKIKELSEKYAWEDVIREIKDGVQTIQYQINTLNSSNGQSPFVSFLLYFDPEDEYAVEAAIIQEEILKQRLEGVENEVGIKMPTSFPKLIYVLDEHNVEKDSPYYYLTELSARASAKTLMPDYISAKKMREHYEGNVFVPMGCRSFLSAWKDKNGNYKFEGRFNYGVVSINLPDVALSSNGSMELFWNILNERVELVKEMGLLRYNQLKDTTSDVAPILWQDGGIARLEKGEKIGKLLKGGYSTYSLGYVGIYETIKILTGDTHTTEEGSKLALDIVKFLRSKVDEWKKETGIGFALYGTPKLLGA